jgi:arylsulfatase A-like enzyme
MAKSPDIILLFAESLSQVDSLYAGGLKNLFPNYDRAARHGIIMTNFISNGCTSDSAHVAVLQGVDPWMHE